MLKGGIDEVKEYPLSDGDIRKILGQNIRILTHPDVAKLSSADQLFDNQGRCIMLFLTQSPTAGHWCCLLNKKKGIEFFDPYGGKPGAILDDVPPEVRQQNGETAPFLEELLRRSGRPVYYNAHDFQKDKADVNTCGRHCVARCLYAPYSLDKYAAIIKKSGLSPDNFVSGLTASALGK